jgi:aspartyl-tRNA(Asn)/glutamyl-tRNA(Gln) amidotransferase subunit A
MSFADCSIAELSDRVRSGALSAEAVARESLASVERARELNAFLHVDHESVLARAAELDARRARGAALGPLAGVPVALKDALCTRDAPTTAASKILTRDGTPASGWRPPYDATVVARLRAADALLVGKTNMDELAMGSSSENSAFGPVKNPWDRARTPGGSSGGSAVAVAAGLVSGALGSDTGGSIRQPAAFTGTVGIKPSYGRVSRFGLVAFASSLDQIGPFARDVASAARLLSVIAGPDPRDATCSTREVPELEAACGREVRGLRVGVSEEYFGPGLEPEIADSVRAAIARLEADGATVVPVALPHTRHAVATYYVLATAEASSNLARFDGVRFGLRREEPGDDLAALYERTRSEGFGREVLRRILLGTYVLSAGYYDAYTAKAQRVRALIARDFADVFQSVDVLATPTSPTRPFALGDRVEDPLSMYLADVYTLPASLAGVAALSLPVGRTGDGLPIGMQLIAPAFEEARLLTVASACEATSPFGRARPPA